LRSEIEKVLEFDHVELDGLLDLVFSAIEAADGNETYRTLDLFWARLAMHIRAEHVRLFPAVRELAEKSGGDLASVPNLLQDLRHDHDFFMRELARAIKAMRLVFYFGNESETFATLRQILEHVKERLEVHNSIEEEKIYTLTTAPFFDLGELVELESKIRKELENYPQRFSADKAAK
jgi:hypothetical protein